MSNKKIIGVTVGTTIKPDKIAEKIGLPAITADDTGKILAVSDDGKWVAQMPDEELSEESTNAVQNKAVATKFAEVDVTIGNIDVLLGTI